MKFFVVSLPKDDNDIVTRSEFYVNDSPVPLAYTIRNTHTIKVTALILFSFQIFTFVMKQVIIE